jgi:ArsR family transcriptional regulator
MRDLITLLKALADPNRLRILSALAGGERCVCQIVELLGLSNSTVSQHLSVLYQARLVESRKEGRWMHYRLPNREACCPQVREAIDWILRTLEKESQTREDARNLRAILKLTPEELCDQQAQGIRCCEPAAEPGSSARWKAPARARST